MKFSKLFSPLLILLSTMPILAHEPLFMMSHEVPGKGAFDIHTAFHSNDLGEEKEKELELESTIGLSRDVAIKISLPYAMITKDTMAGNEKLNSLNDPRIKVKWRFWDKDLLGRKYAAAFAFQSTIPTSSETGRKRPVFLSGLSHGREGLKWYYFVDMRYRYATPALNGSKPGDQLWLDAAYGIRPWVRSLDKTDVVFFLELNYLAQRYSSLVGGSSNPDSGGDFFFISPEVLISPHNRFMFKGGLQIPISQSLHGTQEKRGIAVTTSFEFRFGF